MEKIFGIDVSDHQGYIDWEKAKAAGVQFAILKCGYGMDLADQDDSCYEYNAKECERLGIPYGVYLYSYANTIEKAKSEGEHTVRLLKGKKPTYPIYLDLEEARIAAVGNAQILEQVKAWSEIVEAAGYTTGVYASLLSWWEPYLNDPWYDTKERWVAQYWKECQDDRQYRIWQYSSEGRINGINGNVDCDWMYPDAPGPVKPETPAEPEKPAVPEEEVYTVKSGDTLSEIASKYNTTYQKLAEYNGIQNPNLIYVGQKIRIPGTAAKPASGKSIDELAKEVIRGNWGNGSERERRLTEAGYDYDAIQTLVNELMR